MLISILMILYTFLWCMRIYLFSYFLIWLWGRITSPRVWLGAGGQGVTLKLAWGPSNSSPWICILFLISFQFFLFLSSFYALLFSSFFLSSCIFENGFGTCRLYFSVFFFEIRYNIFLSVYVIITITTYSFFLIIWFLHFGWGQLQTSVF